MLRIPLLLFTLLSVVVCADTPLQAPSLLQPYKLSPYQLTYEASYNGMPIHAKRELQQLPNGNWQLTTSAENFLAKITEQGQFQLNNGGNIHHKNYQYKRNVLGKKKTENLSYDHEHKVANYTTKKKQRQVTLDADYLNRLTYQLQLRRDLANQCEQFEYQVISRGRLKTYRFEQAGEETLQTPLGEVSAIRVNRIREDNDRETALWFAPQLDYLLVKLWQREKDGEEYLITLKEGSIDNHNLSAMLTPHTADDDTEEKQHD